MEAVDTLCLAIQWQPNQKALRPTTEHEHVNVHVNVNVNVHEDGHGRRNEAVGPAGFRHAPE